MKNLAYLPVLFIFLIIPFCVNAQEQNTIEESSSVKQWTVSLESSRIDSKIRKKTERFENKKLYSNMELIELRSIADIQENGVITFGVPGNKRKHSAKAKIIEAESKQDYVWGGIY